MSDTRIYLDAQLASGLSLLLPEGPFRHLVQVLRMQAGESLIAFDGRGGEYEAVIESVAKRGATLAIGAFRDVDRESPLSVTLVQGISKGERMDYTVQKAAELGVAAIVPVVTERCNVSLDRERKDKRLDHWRGVMISACEQSGRTRVPDLYPVQAMTNWLGARSMGPCLMLDLDAPIPLVELPLVAGPISVVIGPEGGLSPAELRAGEQAGCTLVRLGPRLLRTETAGPVALAILQALAGDLRI
ncbi:MAG: 16S rRNA (uracil(1498)-N(3))-methyltransferase [Panacagrimonas sp.]